MMAEHTTTPDHDGMTSAILDAHLEHLRQAGRSDATIAGRREILGRLNAALPGGLGQTTIEELSAWLYRDEWAQNTRATYWAAMTTFYRWATDPRDPWITFDPTEDMPPVPQVRGVPRPVTDEQLRRILTEAPDPIRTWATIAAYQGLRCVEISRLDREFVTAETLFVVRGKGGRPRVHDTDPYVWAAVKDLPAGPVAQVGGRRATPFEISATAHLTLDSAGDQRRHGLAVLGGEYDGLVPECADA